MKKFQQQINECLEELRKVRGENTEAVNNLMANDKKKFYNIIKELNDFEDTLIIDYLE